jgi:hypothetical protein
MKQVLIFPPSLISLNELSLLPHHVHNGRLAFVFSSRAFSADILISAQNYIQPIIFTEDQTQIPSESTHQKQKYYSGTIMSLTYSRLISAHTNIDLSVEKSNCMGMYVRETQ